ncbi:MAG: prepilin-type N-terminal cleavage/methylation domain-containing protein [Deltaproteobacteria bacterium]|nr:prepilin-type N-terminal cleavage/methylation domain-containing protein [Deltaproteobacteria bacterium]
MRRGFSLLEFMVVLAIVGVLVALALPSLGSNSCRAAETEAKAILRGVATQQAESWAKNGMFAEVKASCPKPKAGATPCIVPTVTGTPTYKVTGTGGAKKWTASAVGIAGTRAAGSVWQADQTGAINDVAKICRSAP